MLEIFLLVEQDFRVLQHALHPLGIGTLIRHEGSLLGRRRRSRW
jgi:hypothetical protein